MIQSKTNTVTSTVTCPFHASPRYSRRMWINKLQRRQGQHCGLNRLVPCRCRCCRPLSRMRLCACLGPSRLRRLCRRVLVVRVLLSVSAFGGLLRVCVTFGNLWLRQQRPTPQSRQHGRDGIVRHGFDRCPVAVDGQPQRVKPVCRPQVGRLNAGWRRVLCQLHKCAARKLVQHGSNRRAGRGSARRQQSRTVVLCKQHEHVEWPLDVHGSEMKVATSHLHYIFGTKPGLKKNRVCFFFSCRVGSQSGHFRHRYILQCFNTAPCARWFWL